MPTLEIVSLEEAQGSGVPDYIAIITEVPPGKAGKLSLSEEENPVTVRHRLVAAGKAMNTPLA
jgi:hypothetical protein